MRDRIEREEAGFTLVELLAAMTVMLVLAAIAVPSYLGLRERADRRAAEADLRTAVPAVAAYFADHGTYDAVSMTPAALRAYAGALGAGLDVVSGDASTYCLSSTRGGAVVYKAGPQAAIGTTPCS